MNQVIKQGEDVSIGVLEGKAKDQVYEQPVVVYFDSACPLCRTLAAFMGARIDPKFMIFSPSLDRHPSELVVEFALKGDKTWLSGEDAWVWILRHHPSLQELNWLAQKLGIMRSTTKVLIATTGLLRRFCLRCR